MRVDSHSLVRAAFVLGAMTCFGMAMASMYEAGCAGDLKTGSYGDMAEALRLEARASSVAGVGAILAALVAGTLPRLGSIGRVSSAASVIVVSYIFFLFLGVYFETSGVQSCFP